MLTLKQNIEAVLDSCFSETKDDIKQVALVSIMRLIERTEQTEPSIVCPRCGRSDYIREFGKDFSTSAEKAGYKYKCINCNTYIEPTTEDCSTDGQTEPSESSHKERYDKLMKIVNGEWDEDDFCSYGERKGASDG